MRPACCGKHPRSISTGDFFTSEKDGSNKVQFCIDAGRCVYECVESRCYEESAFASLAPNGRLPDSKRRVVFWVIVCEARQIHVNSREAKKRGDNTSYARLHICIYTLKPREARRPRAFSNLRPLERM